MFPFHRCSCLSCCIPTSFTYLLCDLDLQFPLRTIYSSTPHPRTDRPLVRVRLPAGHPDEGRRVRLHRPPAHAPHPEAHPHPAAGAEGGGQRGHADGFDHFDWVHRGHHRALPAAGNNRSFEVLKFLGRKVWGKTYLSMIYFFPRFVNAYSSGKMFEGT